MMGEPIAGLLRSTPLGSATVCEITLPPRIRAVSSLERIDYHDAFLVQIDPGQSTRTAEEWARTMLEGAPAEVRRALRSGWRSLGLRIGPAGSSELVLGWEVRRRSDDLVLLGAESRVGMPAELVFERRPHALLFATFAQHDNPVVRAVWTPFAPVHRQIVRQILEAGASRP